jgi:hypothetical protein
MCLPIRSHILQWSGKMWIIFVLKWNKENVFWLHQHSLTETTYCRMRCLPPFISQCLENVIRACWIIFAEAKTYSSSLLRTDVSVFNLECSREGIYMSLLTGRVVRKEKTPSLSRGKCQYNTQGKRSTNISDRHTVSTSSHLTTFSSVIITYVVIKQ